MIKGLAWSGPVENLLLACGWPSLPVSFPHKPRPENPTQDVSNSNHSQRPHFFSPLYWGLGFNLLNVGMQTFSLQQLATEGV